MKGEKHMAKKSIKARLTEDGERNELVFEFNPELRIDLNSDDQRQLRVIFYHVVNQLFEDEIEFEFTNDGATRVIYIEIADEYIKQLNEEIRKIRDSIPQL